MPSHNSSETFNVAVIDMQPIDPPIGGGRIRLLGLYHALGSVLPTTYVGAYDWPGPGYREQQLSPNLKEIVVPLSDAHFAAAESWRDFAGGRTIIDSAFPLMAHLSPQYVDRAREVAAKSDVIIVSHPWAYPVVRDGVDTSRQLLVYDSHNLEALLRAELLDDGDFGTEVVKGVLATEFELARRADLVIGCSNQDCALFEEVYDVASEKLHTVPNGVFAQKLLPPTQNNRKQAKLKLNLRDTTAIFIGSAYAPNVEAVKFLCEQVAPFIPEVTFVICGGVAESLELEEVRYRAGANVRFVGVVTEEQKLSYLWAAEIAVNPMFSGSGTNIKMFDFMAIGLAVVSTSVGARGIDTHVADGKTMIVAEADEFAEAVRSIINDRQRLEEVGAWGRKLVEQVFSWEEISPRLGRLLIDCYETKDWSGCRNESNNATSVTMGPHEAPNPENALGLQSGISFKTAAPREIAILTTWGIHCGIAENSMYLIEAFADQGVHCLILSNSEPEAGKAQPDNIIDVKKVWDYGFADPKQVAKACRDASIDQLNIQHHPAFFSADNLRDLVRGCSNRNLDVSVTLHNSVDISEDDLSALAACGTTIVVHNENECLTLADLGAEKAHYIPLGVIEVAQAPRDDPGTETGRRNFPIVGSFGFLRPHKGMLELIEAVGGLRELYPDVKLLGMNALFPSPDSKDYYAKCLERIRELGLEEHVQINSAFLEITEVIRCLAACDLIVLPYHPSTENASASINIAAAAKRPIIVTRQRIFGELKGFLHKVESPRPAVLLAGMSLLLAHPPLMKQLERKIRTYVMMNNWQSVAAKYLKVMFPNGKRNGRAGNTGPTHTEDR